MSAAGWRTPSPSCEAVRRAVGASGHCSSCHSDITEGYPACEIDTAKGVVEVCCVVAVRWDSTRLNRSQPPPSFVKGDTP